MEGPGTGYPPFLRRRRSRMVALAAALPALEAALLLLSAREPGMVLAPQLTAVGPIGAFHDLRWLLVAPDSLLSFTVALVVVLALRTSITIGMVRAFWPSDSPPSIRQLAPPTVGALVVSLVLLAPSTGLLFGVAIAPFSWPVLAAFPAAFLVAALMAHSTASGDWWRGLPPAPAVKWLLASALSLSIAALLIRRLPDVTAPAVALLAGLINARAWDQSMRAIATWEPRSRRPLGALALGGSATIVLVLVAAAFAIFDTGSAPRPSTGSVASAGDRAVLLVAGFESACCGEADAYQDLAEGIVFESYSYAGLDPRGRPIPHGGDATRQDLTLLGERMARQIDELRRRTGQPVDIVAESEGALVTRAYLASRDDPPVGRVMLLSPIEVTGRVSYPELGEDGAGYAGGYLLRLLGEVIEIVSPFDGSIDGPLARSIQLVAEDRSDAFAGFDVVMVVPFADALSAPLPPRSRFSTEVVPAFHGGLRGRGDVKTMITAWLGGERPEGSAAVRFIAGLVSDSFAAWRVPDMGTDGRL